MKIAITGSLGLIGSKLLDRLQMMEFVQVVGFDVRYQKNSPNFLDITNKSDVKEKLSDFDIIIHLAAIARVAACEINPSLCRKTNIDGTQNIIDVCLSSKRKSYLIFASSREIYGNQSNISPVTESSHPNPMNNYARSKLLCEEMIVRSFSNELKAFIIRFSNIYGGMIDHKNRAIPAFCINALKDQPITITGNNIILDFVFIDDVIDGLIKVINFSLNNSIKYLPIMNIVSGKSISLSEVVKIIVKITQSNSEIVFLKKTDFVVEKFCGSNALASKIIQWKPKFDIENGIRKFLNDLNSNSRENINVKQANIRIEEDENFKSYSWLPSEI